MEKITNYLELIQQIQDITPEKEAFCTTGKSLTYSQLYALAKEKQGMLKQEKKEFGEQNAKKAASDHPDNLYFRPAGGISGLSGNRLDPGDPSCRCHSAGG